MNAHNRVMFVDDEDGVRISYDRYFSGHGFDVETAENGANAISNLQNKPVDVVVADLKMPVIDGVELLQWIHDEQPDTRFILLTGYGSEDVEKRVRDLGAYDYLNKPISPDTLAAVVTAAMHLHVDEKADIEGALETETAVEIETEPAAEPVTVKGPLRRTLEIVVGLILAPILGLLFVMSLPIIGFGALFWTLGQTVKDMMKPAHT
ncbi:MAG: response regulator [Planctomycetota bacterium]